MAEEKDNRWRNLAIIIVVLVVLVILIVYVPVLINQIPSEQNDSESTLVALADLSEEKGVDFERLIFGKLVQIDSETGAIDYPRESILDINSNLGGFLVEYGSKLSEEEYKKLQETMVLLSEKISLYDQYYLLLLDLETLDEYWFCEDLEKVVVILERVELVSDSYLGVQERLLNFSQKNNLEYAPINIAFDDELDRMDVLLENIEIYWDSCEKVILSE